MKKVILIEDDPPIQSAATVVFAPEEFEVVIYPDSEMVMTGHFELPDIFIIDKQLPGVDGLEICRQLKRQPSTMHIPVIMMSANPNIGRLSQAAGADDYVEKPYTVGVLRGMVNKYTR